MVLFALKKETINLTSRIPWCMDYPIHQGMLCTLGGMQRVDGMMRIIFLWCQKYIKKDYKPRMPYSFYKE